MSKTQIHKATLRITRDMEIPQYEQRGVELELRAHDELLGTVVFSGAYVYFQKGRFKRWWSFSEFCDMLRNT
jgi:hypothetical protein